MKQKQQNIYGDCALIVASQQDHKDMVQMLLQHENIQINKQDEDGDIALMLASKKSHKEIAEILMIKYKVEESPDYSPSSPENE